MMPDAGVSIRLSAGWAAVPSRKMSLVGNIPTEEVLRALQERGAEFAD